jgi:hypothetical protein
MTRNQDQPAARLRQLACDAISLQQQKSVSFVSESNTIFLSVVSRAAELVIPSALVSITPGKFPTMTR